MDVYWICFSLVSDATFGRGEGLTGVVDQEVDHDELGLPCLDGRTLKGLLNEECANVLYALERQGAEMGRWRAAAQHLLGRPGSRLDDDAHLRVGTARLPANLSRAVRQEVEAQGGTLDPARVLEALTAIRRQTAVAEASGAPEEGTLRAMRVVLRGTPFEARLTLLDGPVDPDLPVLPLLAACVLGLRRAGTGRNRGRGRLSATLHTDAGGRPGREITREQFEALAQKVNAREVQP